MKRFIGNCFTCLLLILSGSLLLCAPVMAQVQTSPALADEHANLPADPTTLLLAAQQVVLMIDQGFASELWPHVSQVIRDRIEKAEFEQRIYASRRPLGVVVGRRWSMIMQANRPDAQGLPSGHYISVVFISDFTGKSNMTEEVVFRQDQDGIWRIAGYSLRH